MSQDKQNIVARTHDLSIVGRNNIRHDLVVQQPSDDEPSANMLELSRSVIASTQQGVISQKEFKHIVTSRFEYAPLQRNGSGMSESLVAAFSPYSAKGRAIRYLAARLVLEYASVNSLCFSVAGAHKNCGTTYIAANLAVAFSELGLRTLIIDGNLRRPQLHRLFACEQTQGLSTAAQRGASPTSFVAPLPLFQKLSLLPAGKNSKRMPHALGNSVMAALLPAVRRQFDVVICDSPAMTNSNTNCEIVAGICRTVLSVLRKNHTRVSSARKLLASLDAVGAQPLGSVLCDF
jgi:protein-tyrosine kinase